MHKARFTVDESSWRNRLYYEHDENDIIEGYTDQTLWNGWINVCFSKDQISKFLDATPFDYRFFKKNGLPCLRIYFTDHEEEIDSTPLPTDEMDIIEGYFLGDVHLIEVINP